MVQQRLRPLDAEHHRLASCMVDAAPIQGRHLCSAVVRVPRQVCAVHCTAVHFWQHKQLFSVSLVVGRWMFVSLQAQTQRWAPMSWVPSRLALAMKGSLHCQQVARVLWVRRQLPPGRW
jgi:hypothetical protein